MGRELARSTDGEITEEARAPLALVPIAVDAAEAQVTAADQEEGGETTAGSPQGPDSGAWQAAPPLGEPQRVPAPGQRRRRVVELLCVLALLGSVATVALLAWNTGEVASIPVRWHTVLTMSSSDPRVATGVLTSAPFLTHNNVRVLLTMAPGASPTHLAGTIAVINQANAPTPPASRTLTLSSTASEVTISGLNGLCELLIVTHDRQRWSLAIQTPS